MLKKMDNVEMEAVVGGSGTCVAAIASGTVIGGYGGANSGYTLANNVTASLPPQYSKPVQVVAATVGAVAGAVAGAVTAAYSPACKKH